MSKKYAFLFPGQGTQTPGMLKDVCESFPEAKKILDDISEVAGIDVPKLLWESDAEFLSRSENSQLSVMSSSVAICAVLKSHGIEPSAVAGYSLGEYSALYISEVLNFEDCVKVVRKRGLIMQKVCEEIRAENEGHLPGMSAIVGLPPEKIQELCDSTDGVYAANFNSATQTVVSGTFEGLLELEKKAKEIGGRRGFRLAVAGPYHSPLMQKAADEFSDFIKDISFSDPKIALFSNVTGAQMFTADEVKKNAVLHIPGAVRWTTEEPALADFMEKDKSCEWCVREVGVANILTGLWNDTEFKSIWECKSLSSVGAILKEIEK